MQDVLTTGSRQVWGVWALTWLPAAAGGWLVHLAVLGSQPTSLLRAGSWLAGLAVAALIGTALARLLPARPAAGPAAAWAGFVALGSAAAMAGGWIVDVAVGGPMSGIVVGIAAAAARAGPPDRRIVALTGAGAVGVAAAWTLAVDLPGLFPALAAAGGGVVVVAGLGRALVPSLPLRRVALLVVAWATAWVGAYEITDALLGPISLGLAVGVEIVVAVALGAAVLGRVVRSETGEPVQRVVRRWTVAAALGVAAAMIVAGGLNLVPGAAGGGVFTHLDVGTVLGYAVAAATAALPTIRRLTGRRPVELPGRDVHCVMNRSPRTRPPGGITPV